MKSVMFLAIPTISAYLLKLNWELFAIYIIFMILDLITGSICAAKEGKLESKVMKQGLLKKAGEIVLVMVIIIAQRMIMVNGIDIPPVFEIFVTALSFKEIGSILENQIKLGIRIPPFITKWFKVAQDTLKIEEQKEDQKTEVSKNEQI